MANTLPRTVCVPEDEVQTLLAGVKNVAVSFDSALIFSALIPLPWATKNKSEKILSIRRDQTLPVQKDSYFHGWFELEAITKGEKRFVSQIVIKRELIDRVVHQLKNSESNCEMLFVRDGHAKSLPVAWNASGTSYHAVEIGRWRRYFWLGLSGLVIGVTSVGGSLVYQQSLKSQIVESRIARLQPEATRLSKLRRTQDQLPLNLANASIPAAAQSVLGETLGLIYSVDARVSGSLTIETPEPVSASQLLAMFEAALRDAGAGISVQGANYRIVPLVEASRSTAALQTETPDSA